MPIQTVGAGEWEDARHAIASLRPGQIITLAELECSKVAPWVRESRMHRALSWTVLGLYEAPCPSIDRGTWPVAALEMKRAAVRRLPFRRELVLLSRDVTDSRWSVQMRPLEIAGRRPMPPAPCSAWTAIDADPA